MSEALQHQATNQAPVYSDFGGDEDLGELVELYVEEMPGRIQALIEASQNPESDELARLAHQLKGASGSYGFMQISRVAAQLEYAVRNGADNIESLLQETINICQRAKAGTP